MSDFPGPWYRLCDDDDCPDAYAFRAPFPVVPHWHFVGPTPPASPDFAALSDETWGVGQWMQCPLCLDSKRQPAYHHKDAHAVPVIVRHKSTP